MKKTLKKILIATGIIIGLLIVMTVAYLFKFKSETGKMTPIATSEIIENVFSIKDSFVNMYFVKNGENYIAIDGGNDADNIEKGLKELNIDPSKVKAVFLTHCDNDHIASISIFENAKIYIAKEEEQIMNGQTARFFIFKDKKNFEHDVLADNQEFEISGIHIKCILSPGHTPGSMCFLIGDKFLFVGDNMSLKNGKIDPFNDFFNIDTKLQSKSLKKLALLTGVEYIFTAHYGYTNEFTQAFKNWK